MCVCVCVCERERERESVCVCVRERERECVCVCVCVTNSVCPLDGGETLLLQMNSRSADNNITSVHGLIFNFMLIKNNINQLKALATVIYC